MNPARPSHGRKLGLLAADLVKAPKIPHDIDALKATRDQLEQILVESAYLKDAPFSWVTVSIRFGLKNEDVPHYEKINKRYGDLPLAIEVDTHELLDVSLEQLTLKFKVAVLKALIHAGKKFKRPTEQLEVELVRLDA
jgi:hypothetical protein